MAKFTGALSLVKFQGEYFPLTESDFLLLRERNVSVFRISESTLDILTKVLLKGVKIEQHPWSKVYPRLLESFKKGLLSTTESEDTYGFKHEQNWLLVMTDTSKEENSQATVQYSNQLSEFMGRYGIRTKIEVKPREGFSLTKLTFQPDENIVPSFYFGCKDSYNDPISFEFNLSSSARLKFSKRLTVQGEPTFSVSFEDKFGDQFQEAFTRGFPFSLMKAKDCEAAIEFFIGLHNRLTVKSLKTTPQGKRPPQGNHDGND